MDYHFLKPKKQSNSSELRNIPTVATRFLPLFLLAAILPFLIGFVVSPPKLGFMTRADSEGELRVWLEPANLVMSAGSEAEFSVVAYYENGTRLIPEISLEVAVSGPVSVVDRAVARSVPFSGRTELGKVRVRATGPGKAIVNILQESVLVTAFDGGLDINTGVANVVVR